jgi:hypothetical protein
MEKLYPAEGACEPQWRVTWETTAELPAFAPGPASAPTSGAFDRVPHCGTGTEWAADPLNARDAAVAMEALATGVHLFRFSGIGDLEAAWICVPVAFAAC